MCSILFVFFKQKTAYEMRISDWSSDVCSSDLKSDQSDPQSGTIDNLGGGQEQFAAVLAINVRGQHRIGQLAGDLLYPIRAEGEFPMERHGIEAQLGHERHKSFCLVRNREMRSMERVAIV